MKKVLAFLLALSMCLVLAAGCTKISDDDPAAKGAEFDIYLGKKVTNLDPAIAYTDENAVKILNLIFEGLFKLDENGNRKKALAKKYEVLEDPKTGEEYLEITIKDTYWSTGNKVSANDVVYAWRRILNPEFDSPAASMLYCIKGAKEAKEGGAGSSIYDVGLWATKSNKIRVNFEEGANIEEFLDNLASPALVPLRENKVASYPDTWSKSATDLATNGPFRVKKFDGSDPTELITLERSKYYYLNQEVETEAKDKFVTPYRINLRFDVPMDNNVVASDSDTDILTMFNNKELFYVSGLTAATAGAYKNVKTEEEASAFMFYFNFASDPFEMDNADSKTIRQAFSMALDRTAIAQNLGLGTTAATGILNGKVYNTKKGTSFRKAGGDVVSASSGITEAKALLENAGIDPTDYDTIYVLVRGDEMNDSYASSTKGFRSNEKAILETAVKAWQDLGFEVELDIRNAHDYDENGEDLGFIAKYESGEYDIVGMDYQMISTYALYDLAMFSSEYSGGASLLKGYTNEEFDNLLAEAFAESDLDKRAEILHSAETKLVKDEAAVIPVVFNANAYVVSKELSNVKTDYWGVQIFTKTALKNYVQYLPSVRNNSSDEE